MSCSGRDPAAPAESFSPSSEGAEHPSLLPLISRACLCSKFEPKLFQVSVLQEAPSLQSFSPTNFTWVVTKVLVC